MFLTMTHSKRHILYYDPVFATCACVHVHQIEKFHKTIHTPVAYDIVCPLLSSIPLKSNSDHGLYRFHDLKKGLEAQLAQWVKHETLKIRAGSSSLRNPSTEHLFLPGLGFRLRSLALVFLRHSPPGLSAIEQASRLGNPKSRSLPRLKTWLIFKGFMVRAFPTF